MCIRDRPTTAAKGVSDPAKPAVDAAVSIINRTQNPKEVKIPNFPSINYLTAYLAKVARNLCNASTYDDRREALWLREIDNKTYAELNDYGEERFAKVDSLMVVPMEFDLPCRTSAYL